MTTMRRIIPVLFASFALCSAEEPSATPVLTKEQLPNWKMAGPGTFEFAEGVATAKGGMGLWWLSSKELRNLSSNGTIPNGIPASSSASPIPATTRGWR